MSRRIAPLASYPTTSAIWATLRRPSGMRAWWTMRLTADAICARTASNGMSIEAIITIVSRRESASRAELEWMVDMLPSWPVFMACSMSSASAPRTSPTRIRSGRIRRLLRRSCRIVSSPLPSTLAGLCSSAITCGWSICSSAASSIVITRWLCGMKRAMTLRVVVLPEPVPPDTRMFMRPSTAASRNSAMAGLRLPSRVRSSMPSTASLNFRIVSAAPWMAAGLMIALTRLPSGRRASTIGFRPSIWRPVVATMRRIVSRSWFSSSKRTSALVRTPRRSMKTWSGPLTMISLTDRSCSRPSSGP